MIEQGFVSLVQGTPAVAAIAVSGGGFYAELPKSQILPSWSYLTVSQNPWYGLLAQPGLTAWRVQVDCFGNDGADAINLAKAIDKVLSGFRGTLTDPDATGVDSCFRSDVKDFYDPAARTYRRMLEYELWYYQSW